jgi:hypothetical protein
MKRFIEQRSHRKDAAIPIAWEDRREAGCTGEEPRALSELSVDGPSRETLMT